ncbi:DUF4253 domain-containing protein [Asticcacaulis sp. AC402]|uniref:DUF4253 domain-containing protein n=1 Tax=Asticcacaulis sp. AC402 TaxID=1282361 RepID=UPI0003C41045|nr:DUF4253 domain-containing protein [Asticcacaulis sp. AC402]ESQ74080.1 hypothetical protein ABAC402_15625 [Asticcacaulis sp. AC402]
MIDFTKRWLMSAMSALGFVSANPAAAQLDTSSFAEELKDFPYEFITVDGAMAEAEWLRLTTAGRGWPVVVGGDDNLRIMAEVFAFNSEDPNHTPAAILKAAEAIKFPEDLKAWHDAYDLSVMEKDFVGEWPTDLEPYDLGISVATDIADCLGGIAGNELTGKFLPKVHIVLVPTDKSWETPAYLKWGGGNECPPAEYHVARLKLWHENFGADVAGMSGDVLNLRVRKPVQEKAEAIAVAKEQFLYCSDIVLQGTNDIATLAATLVGQRYWYFWWNYAPGD